jgi:ADP-ribosylglycohydrolase
MIGAIIGDIAGSIFEFRPHKSTKFPLFVSSCRFTDDSVLTIALADCILTNADYVDKLKEYALRYPQAGYGGSFKAWVRSDERGPYNSYGNGSAMRTSPVGYAYNTLEEVLLQAKKYAAVTHNHPEGIKGAQATAACIFLARTGKSKAEIKQYVETTFEYNLDKSIDDIRTTYKFDVTCQGSVPQAIRAFLEADSYEQAIRLAISLGGDSDTQGCITGGIAQAAFGVPLELRKRGLEYLDDKLRTVICAFEAKFLAAKK